MAVEKVHNFIALLLALILLAVAVSGCTERGLTENSRGVSEELVISGSSSMEEMNNTLADAYAAENPGVKIRVQALGSSEGIQAAIAGIAEIGASSRALTGDEKVKAPAIQEIAVARDGIAIVVHPSNPVNDLRKEQIKAVYSGQIRNWKELGGNNKEITVLRREDGSGTLGAFCELVMGAKEQNTRFWPPSIVQNSSGSILNTVAMDPNAIGFVSMAVVDSRVKAIGVDGAEPSFENVINGSYSIQRPFNYIVKGIPQGTASRFIDFALSPAGQALVAEAGAIPLKQTASPSHVNY